jgi:hypothetical protein
MHLDFCVLRLSLVRAVWCIKLRSIIRLNFIDSLNDYLIIVLYFLIKLMQFHRLFDVNIMRYL